MIQPHPLTCAEAGKNLSAFMVRAAEKRIQDLERRLQDARKDLEDAQRYHETGIHPLLGKLPEPKAKP